MHTEPGSSSEPLEERSRRPFGGAPTGTPLGPLTIAVSRGANERYWRSAGAAHALLEAGVLYPPIAANLTILLFQTVAPRPLLHTAQRLVCHRSALAGQALEVVGTLTDRFTKRGREYAVVEAEITIAAENGSRNRLWTSIATFCEIS